MQSIFVLYNNFFNQDFLIKFFSLITVTNNTIIITIVDVK